MSLIVSFNFFRYILEYISLTSHDSCVHFLMIQVGFAPGTLTGKFDTMLSKLNEQKMGNSQYNLQSKLFTLFAVVYLCSPAT